MVLYVVRHALAVERSTWTRGDAHRPLTEYGEIQARSIAALVDEPPAVVVSSPTLRCVGTVLALAERFEVDIITRSELLPNRPAAAAELIRGLLIRRPAALVVCTHGEVIPSLLASLGVTDSTDPLDRCNKGSIWRIDHDARRVSARYIEVPSGESSNIDLVMPAGR